MSKNHNQNQHWQNPKHTPSESTIYILQYQGANERHCEKKLSNLQKKTSLTIYIAKEVFKFPTFYATILSNSEYGSSILSMNS